MDNIQIETLAKQGKTEVIRFMAIPQLFASERDAINAVGHAVDMYILNGRPYNRFIEPDNPFVQLIIHFIGG